MDDAFLLIPSGLLAVTVLAHLRGWRQQTRIELRRFLLLHAIFASLVALFIAMMPTSVVTWHVDRGLASLACLYGVAPCAAFTWIRRAAIGDRRRGAPVAHARHDGAPRPPTASGLEPFVHAAIGLLIFVGPWLTSPRHFGWPLPLRLISTSRLADGLAEHEIAELGELRAFYPFDSAGVSAELSAPVRSSEPIFESLRAHSDAKPMRNCRLAFILLHRRFSTDQLPTGCFEGTSDEIARPATTTAPPRASSSPPRSPAASR
jgi:hypothetical protein